MYLRTKITITILTILILMTTLGDVSAWIEPETLPPSGTLIAPLNSSALGQSKIGGLILNLGGAAHGLIVKYGLVGIGTDNPQSLLDVVGTITGTGLEVNSETEGVLVPRMTIDQRKNISVLEDGLLIYNTSEGRFNYYIKYADGSGGEWKVLGENATSSTLKITTEYAIGDGNPGDYYCKKKNITDENQQETWVNINEGKICGLNNKICNSGQCVAGFTCGVSQVDDSDGNSYDTIQIGSQCWMKQNMRVGSKLASGATMPSNNGVREKWCYANSDANCNVYGGLYSWDEAMQYSTAAGAQGICPAGWHIPTDGEQFILINYLKDAGQTCDASSTLWQCSSAGTKLQIGGSSGFNSPIGGFRDLTTGSFYLLGAVTGIWASSQNGTAPYEMMMNSGYALVMRGYTAKNYGYSVRCLKN